MEAAVRTAYQRIGFTAVSTLRITQRADRFDQTLSTDYYRSGKPLQGPPTPRWHSNHLPYQPGKPVNLLRSTFQHLSCWTRKPHGNWRAIGCDTVFASLALRPCWLTLVAVRTVDSLLY
jgi:hypothetical protein